MVAAVRWSETLTQEHHDSKPTQQSSEFWDRDRGTPRAEQPWGTRDRDKDTLIDRGRDKDMRTRVNEGYADKKAWSSIAQ